MNRRNKILLVVMIVLLVANIGIYFSGGISKSVSYDPEMFAITDTAAINLVKMTSPGRSISIQRSQNGWGLNDQYQVDEGLRRLLFSIFQRIRVRKPVDQSPAEGFDILIVGEEESSFTVYSNPTKTKTFFYDPSTGKSYEVEIPGYHEYLGGIFELSPNQWRDRMIMDENWRTIKSLTLDYQQSDRQDIQLVFAQDFFEVPGVSKLDTTRLIDYLNQFQVFEVNEIISVGEFPKYDSLSRSSPIARLEIQSIKSNQPVQLSIYPKIGKDQFQLVRNQSDQLMVIDSKRLNQILIEQLDFQEKD